MEERVKTPVDWYYGPKQQTATPNNVYQLFRNKKPESNAEKETLKENLFFDFTGQLYKQLDMQLYKQPDIDFGQLYKQLYDIINMMATTNAYISSGEVSKPSGKGDQPMDWQEKYLDKLDRDVSDMKNAITSSEERIARMIDSTMAELRDRDNQRHAEMSEIRSSIQGISSELRETTQSIYSELREEKRWVIAMAITTILGVAAMVITVLTAK